MNVILSIPSTDPLNLEPPPEYKFIEPGLKNFHRILQSSTGMMGVANGEYQP